MKHAVSLDSFSLAEACIPTQSSLLVAFVLSCGLALLLVPEAASRSAQGHLFRRACARRQRRPWHCSPPLW